MVAVNAKAPKVGLTMLEWVDSQHRKFYNVFIQYPRRGLVHWGRIGTRGQSQVLTYREALDRLDEKKREGYTEILCKSFFYPTDGSWDPVSLLEAAHRIRVKTDEFLDQESIFQW